MKYLVTLVLILLLPAAASTLSAQSTAPPTAQPTNTGVISGQVTLKAKPAPHVTMVLYGNSAATEVRDYTDKSEEKKKDIPPEFRSIDFENFSYPISFNLAYTPDVRRRTVQLKDGTHEYQNRNGLGGAMYKLDDVDYVDLTGDGQKEAIVQLSQTICGGSCDGGSDFFYFYSIANGKPRLLSRLETGSAGYDCGLKFFILKKQVLNLETFRVCRFNGVEFKPASDDPEETGGKFLTNRFTRFVLRFNRNRFVLSQRKVFPCPEEDRRSYQPKFEISND